MRKSVGIAKLKEAHTSIDCSLVVFSLCLNYFNYSSILYFNICRTQYRVSASTLNGWHFAQRVDTSVWPLLCISAIRCVSARSAVPNACSAWMFHWAHRTRNLSCYYERMRTRTRLVIGSYRLPICSIQPPHTRAGIRDQNIEAVSSWRLNRRTPRSS